jgi:hypothetical protein
LLENLKPTNYFLEHVFLKLMVIMNVCYCLFDFLFQFFSYNFLPVLSTCAFVSSFQNPTPTAAHAPPAPESGVSVVQPVPPTANTGTNVSRSQGKVANVPANIQQNTHLANLLRQPVSDKNSRVLVKLTILTSTFLFVLFFVFAFVLVFIFIKPRSKFSPFPGLSTSILVLSFFLSGLYLCG